MVPMSFFFGLPSSTSSSTKKLWFYYTFFFIFRVFYFIWAISALVVFIFSRTDSLALFSSSNYLSILEIPLILLASIHLAYIFFSFCNLANDKELDFYLTDPLDYILGNSDYCFLTLFWRSWAFEMLFFSHACFFSCMASSSSTLCLRFLF